MNEEYIRIEPQWNVNMVYGIDTIIVLIIRIEPQWNVNTAEQIEERLNYLLEQNHSGM